MLSKMIIMVVSLVSVACITEGSEVIQDDLGDIEDAYTRTVPGESREGGGCVSSFILDGKYYEVPCVGSGVKSPKSDIK